MRIARTAKIMLAATSVVAAMLTTAPQAQATGAGECILFDGCFYYNSNQKGASFGFGGYGPHTTQRFGGGGSGSGVLVKNNAASVWNREGWTFRIDYNSTNKCAYACQYVAPWKKANLNSKLKNNNAAHIWVGDWVDGP